MRNRLRGSYVYYRNMLINNRLKSPGAHKLRDFLFYTVGAYVDKLQPFKLRIKGSNPLGGTISFGSSYG